MKTKLLTSKMFKATLVVTGLLLTGTVFGQTIGAGQTVLASSLGTNPTVTIQANGTLDMDISKTFTAITTSGSGISNISGLGAVTVNNAITLGAGNTLSITSAVTAVTLATANLSNATVTVDGTGSLTAGATTINAANSQSATLVIGSAVTVQSGNISDGNGNGGSDYILSANGYMKFSGTLDNKVDFSAGTASTIEYNGGNQTIRGGTYNNLISSGTGTKTLAGNIIVSGDILIEAGSDLTLGGDDITINTANARTTTINGTLDINGNGRLLQSNFANKTLVLGPQGILNLTDVASGNGLELPSFNLYTFAATSTVNYGANDGQIIADIAAPGYGNLTISGTTGSKDAQGNMDIQRNLTITSSTFNAGNFTHSVKGDWIRDGGTFTTSTGRISFTGAAAQEIRGSQNTTFYNVTFANTSGGVSLKSPTSIANNVTFTNGIVTSDATNLLTFNGGASTGVSSDISFVNGPVRKVFNNATETQFIFPLGVSGTGNEPLTVSGVTTGGVNYDFTAEYKRGSAADLGTAYTVPVKNVSACDYWDLNKNAGKATGVSVTLTWDINSPCNGTPYVTTPATLTVAHLNGTTWEQAGTGVTNFTANSVTRTNVTAFSPFSLGNTVIGDNPLPVVFGNVKAYEKNNGVQVEWSNMTEKDVAEYTIERSANGKDFSAIGKQLPTSNQDDKASYTAFDAVPGTGANYYRIKAEETTGKIVYSKVLSVNLGKANSGLRLYPNPVSGNQVTVSLSNVKHGKYNLRVVSIAGQDIFKQVINNQSNSLTQTLDLPSSIKPGVYNMIITGDNYRETKSFIVQ